jgi:hypothetical protein
MCLLALVFLELKAHLLLHILDQFLLFFRLGLRERLKVQECAQVVF